MTDYTPPAWLTEALAEAAESAGDDVAAELDESPPPGVGQLRVIQHRDVDAGANRMGLIVHVDAYPPVVRFLLLSPLLEARTSSDYVLEPEDSTSAMRLIVESDLRGAVWYPTQLGACVGTCAEELVTALDAVGRGTLPGDVGLAQARFGLPARDERDSRWSWKLAEFEELTSLTHECDEWLMGDADEEVIFDLPLLQEIAELGVVTPEVVMSLLTLIEERGAGLAGDIDSLEALLALQGRVDPGLQAVLLMLQERELGRLSTGSSSPQSEIVVSSVTPLPDRLRGSLAGALASLAGEDHPCASFVTNARAWPTDSSGALIPAVATLSGKRLQIVPIDFDAVQSEVAA